MKKNKNGFGKILIGAGIGAGLAMLFTKNNGKENREALKNKANEKLPELPVSVRRLSEVKNQYLYFSRGDDEL